MTRRRPHTYTCPDCKRPTTTDAAWRARWPGQPCLGCARKRSGWQHKPGCIDPDNDDHPGACVTEP